MRLWFYLKFTYRFKGWVLRTFFAQEIEWIKDAARSEVVHNSGIELGDSCGEQ